MKRQNSYSYRDLDNHSGRNSGSYRRKQTAGRKKRRLTAVLFCMTAALAAGILFSNLSRSSKSSAGDKNAMVYHTVQIERGDSLWGIASENLPAGYTSVDDYMKEIISVNQLASDQIMEDGYLILPAYQ